MLATLGTSNRGSGTDAKRGQQGERKKRELNSGSELNNVFYARDNNYEIFALVI